MNIQSFSLSEPTPVLDQADIFNYLESVLLYEKYYTPPIDLSSLAKAIRSSAHHQSALMVKKNILMSTCQTSPLLPRSELEKLVQDFLIFGNAYLQCERNREFKITRLSVPLAKYMRRGKQAGSYYLISADFQDYEFKNGSILHLKQADINQEIYGLPDYLGALQSALLNESATLFRRKYYLNGAHAGSIIYMTDPMANEGDIDGLKEQLKQAKGKGNFKNLFLYAPDGKENGIKVIPLSDVVAKDEFLNIKNTSRDDVLAAHRVPPQLMGIIPTNNGGFGDVEKAGKVFFINEIKPLQQRLQEINDWVGQEVIRFTPYELLNEN